MLVEFRVHEVFLRTANKKRGQSTSECSHTMIDSLTLEAEQPRKCCEQAFSSLSRAHALSYAYVRIGAIYSHAC